VKPACTNYIIVLPGIYPGLFFPYWVVDLWIAEGGWQKNTGRSH